MLWYRQRPHEAYHRPIPPIHIQHLLNIAWCYKVRGYTSGRLHLCHTCYAKSNNPLFTAFYSHLLFSGRNPLIYECDRCFSSITSINLIQTCQLCARKHLNFFERYPNDVHTDETTLIYLSGYDILREDWR